MDKGRRRTYSKVLKYYERGEINKSLNICNKEIAKDMGNRSVLNLNGLMLYLKGDLKGARNIWKINYEVNKDNVAGEYIESLTRDEKREKYYLNALRLSNSNNIREAHEFIEKCMDSDFNAIDVNNLNASLCIKTMEYNKAIKSLDIALRKELIKLGIINKGKYNKLKGIGIICLIMIILAPLAYGVVNNFNMSDFNIASLNFISMRDNNSSKEDDESSLAVENNNTLVEEDSETKEEKDINKENIKEETEEKVETFNSREVKDKISSKDYKYIDNIIKTYKNEELKINDKMVLNSAIEFMNKEGVELAYKEASNLIKDEKFMEAMPMLNIAEEYSGDSYLSPHILYMKGFLSESTEDVENALKYYQEYVDKYKKGEYTEEVLYRLALIYKGIDKPLAVKYARRLVDEFPQSMYNNSNIKNILN
ncbi:tol-pal system YbgF family protein [Clostridium sp.]|uniref:tol-pal system YbgF family protein n=1 Tax=Clostridium sp. TaxID=1506 RepID=UPI003464C154